MQPGLAAVAALLVTAVTPVIAVPVVVPGHCVVISGGVADRELARAALDDLVQFAAVQPDPTAFHAKVYLDSLPF